MHSKPLTCHVAATGAPDVCWPQAELDLEPEICHCLPHGHELPCAVCERRRVRLDGPWSVSAPIRPWPRLGRWRG
jgi:hypothetical protein